MRYEDIDAVNPSSLKIMWKSSPLHYLHALTHPREETPAMRVGTAVHMAVLQPELFERSFVAKPEGLDGRTVAGKAWLAAVPPTVVILTHAEGEAIRGMAEAVLSSAVARPYIGPGRVEEPIVWTDPTTGIVCKGRPDVFTDTSFLSDLKTARDLNERRFIAQAFDLGYLFSQAMYADGLSSLAREPRETVLVCVESVEPHDVVVYRLDGEPLEVGRDQYKTALVTLKRCRDTGRWPGRAETVVDLELPVWALPDEVEDDADDYKEAV